MAALDWSQCPAVDEFVKAYRVADKYKGFNADANSVRANAEAILAAK